MPTSPTAKPNRPQIAVIVGSNRRESINRKLAEALAKLGAGKFDAKIVRIDDLPMYNRDNEANLPAEVARFKNEVAKADGVLIVTPEHDRSMPAVLKNAIDWGARPYGKNSWVDKPTFITGTSPARLAAHWRSSTCATCSSASARFCSAAKPTSHSSRTLSTTKATSPTKPRKSSCKASSIVSQRSSSVCPPQPNAPQREVNPTLRRLGITSPRRRGRWRPRRCVKLRPDRAAASC